MILDLGQGRLTRRGFITKGLAGAVSLYLTGCGPSTRLAHIWGPPPDEDGYRLWLRYEPVYQVMPRYRQLVRRIRIESGRPTMHLIAQELVRGLSGLIGKQVTLANDGLLDGDVVVTTAITSPLIESLKWADDLKDIGNEGFIIRTVQFADKRLIVVAANTSIGALYGSFHLLRMMQTCSPIESLDIRQRPCLQLRLMNHWDNLNGTIERGYAGRSLWQWDQLPQELSPRYVDYARACASIGINGSVINNVNADPRVLTAPYLRKVSALADLWRPYGIRIYLSANFASPIRIGNLRTADPMDSQVIDWWRAKADEIYQLIPDFGGFLVKADSEGQPGPKTYGRTHAQGANLLADALAPCNGVVIWRAFVYDQDVDPDRAKRAYIEFTGLDGQFQPNVIIQVKNGPIDFQPREPFHPLFGAMKKTPVMAEIQATQEYRGQAKHLVYLGTMWEEFLDSDTYAKGPGSTVARVLMGQVHPYKITGMACVVNPGTDTNWCGHHFSQANWYAFGRLAWDPELSAKQIAEEWVRMTFTNDNQTVATICQMMMDSHEIYVNYTMPLGLHHLIGGDHYAPMPWNDRAARADWTATYYHQASEDGIGFDRTRNGSRAVDQYYPPLSDIFNDIDRCPEKYLLWFHHCKWDHRLRSGKTLWQELCARYKLGAAQAEDLATRWQGLAGKIDSMRHRQVAERLAIQVADANKWQRQILEYFSRFSKHPIPS